MRRRSAPASLLLALAFGWLLAGAQATLATQAGDGDRDSGDRFAAYRGRSLEEALLDLGLRGLAVAFSSELVNDGMIVDNEPHGTDLKDILEQLLRPHGLSAREEAGGTMVVVPLSPFGQLRGEVRSSHSDEPLDGATLRIRQRLDAAAANDEHIRQAKTAANGRFRIDELATGEYSLEIQHAGYVPSTTQVLIEPERTSQIRLGLKPLPYLHDEIVVSASELTLLQEDPAAPLALNRRQVQALPHLGGDVFRALTFLPGTVANDTTAQFSVHGGRRDEIEIRLDGQELYQAFHLRDYDNGLSVIAADNLSGVSLSTGAYSAEHGDRMSAVLDLTTQEARDRHTRLGLSLLTLEAATAGPIRKNRGNYMLSVRRGSIDLASRLFRKGEHPSFWDLFAKLDFPLGERHRLGLRFLRPGDQLELLQTIDGEFKNFETQYDSSYLWLSHDAILTDRLLLESSLSKVRFDRDRRGIEDEEEGSFDVDDRRDFDVVGLRQSYSARVGPQHTLTWGFEARRYKALYDYANRTEPPLLPPTVYFEPRSTIARFAGRFEGDHLGVWLSDRFVLRPMTVELGARYDRHSLTDDTLWSPRINLAWRVGDRRVVRLGWGHFYQTQRPYELAVEDGETRFASAERSTHWVLGYEQQFGRNDLVPVRAFRVELYGRSIENPRARYTNLYEPINAFPEIEPDRVRLTPEDSLSEGIELILRGAAGRRTEWWLTYAYARSTDTIVGSRVRREQDQPHTFHAALSHQFGRAWQIDVAWRYHSGWPTTPIDLGVAVDDEGEAEAIIETGRINSDRLVSYHRMDFRLSRRFRLRQGELRFFIDVQNTYDRQNLAGFDVLIEEEEEDGEEPTFEKVPERWPGALPSIGVVWEF